MFTQYSVVDDLITSILFGIRKILGEKFVGLYLYGSATAGDFDVELSDVDLLTVIKEKLLEEEFVELEKMHLEVSKSFPKWRDRIEIIYATREGLNTFREKQSEIAAVSPGEPFHLKQAGSDWLINWYVMRTSGLVVFGPSVSDIIPEISETEYIEAVRKYGLSWKIGINDYNAGNSRGSVAYVIFTMCRALYGVRYKKRLSKLAAAEWMGQEYPQWKLLIEKAIEWRKVQWKETQEAVGSDLATVVEFVNFVVGQIEN